MDDFSYFRSLTQELNALKDRVRYFIKDHHWLSDGEWKESVLRAVLRRHLPKTYGVGSGFIATEKGPSTQVDILIYDTTKPILFQDGDFVIVTPDLVSAIIEVKTSVSKAKLPTILQKLSSLHQKVAFTAQCQPFVGMFAYNSNGCDYTHLLETLYSVVEENDRRNIHCVSLGSDLFCRYWHSSPENPRGQSELWRAYHLAEMAPAYFIHNVIESLCYRSVIDNNFVWYPREGKESYQLGEKKRKV